MLRNDSIEPSTSSYNSPIILIKKKSSDGQRKYRLCIDFRQLNKKLIPDKFPLPRIDNVLDNLGKAKFFSTLDLYSGFWQIPLTENSRNPTSFSCGEGSFRFKVVPFGLNVAPNSFARMMSVKNWHQFVKYFAFAFNTTPNTAIDMYSPFELVFGRPVSRLTANNQDLEQIKSSIQPCDYINEVVHNLEIAYKRTKDFIINNKHLYKKYYDRFSNSIDILFY